MIRIVQDRVREYSSQWGAFVAIADKIGCSSETVRNWIAESQRTAVRQLRLTSTALERLKNVERENRELRRANEILRSRR